MDCFGLRSGAIDLIIALMQLLSQLQNCNMQLVVLKLKKYKNKKVKDQRLKLKMNVLTFNLNH